MSAGTTPNDSARLTQEASDWYARMRSADVSDIDAARFRAWLGGAPERRREFEEMDALWEGLEALKETPEVAQWRSRRRGLSLRSALAAAAVVVLTVGALWIHERVANRYVTGVGEQRTVPLPDGSIVTLNTATELSVRYSSAQR